MCFAASVTFARSDGIIPAPEPTHALAAVIEEAKRCTESGEQKVIKTTTGNLGAALGAMGLTTFQDFGRILVLENFC